MKNILYEKPDAKLNPRMRESVSLVLRPGVKGAKILDIGCGYGWFEYHLLKEDITEITGIEITEQDLKTTKDNLKHKKARFSIGGALELPFDDQSFDIVVAWEVIEHIPKHTEEKMFAEVSRVLRRGGHFYLSTPYNSLLSKILDPAWWLIGHRHYSEAQLKKFGEGVNLEPVTIMKKGGPWSLVSTLDMYVSKWIFRRSPIFGKFIAQKEAKEYSKDDGIASIFAVYKK